MDKWSQIYKNEGKDYGYYDLFKPHESIQEIETIFRQLGIQRILDLGCGVGRNLIYLLKKGFDLYGLDLSKEGINQLKEIIKTQRLSANLFVGDAYKQLPYNNNYFDAVISVQVLQHSSERKILKAIEEIRRILKPGGYIFITLCGRYSQGKLRKYLVKTAKKIAAHTYIPTEGSEAGLTHFIYNKPLIKKHFKGFKITKFWKDSKDYYCFFGKLIS